MRLIGTVLTRKTVDKAADRRESVSDEGWRGVAHRGWGKGKRTTVAGTVDTESPW